MSQRCFQVEAPSNIALIKYWGKSDPATQWPSNDSLSMTLTQAHTTTTVQQLPDNSEDSFVFAGQPVDWTRPFGAKVKKHLQTLKQHFDAPNARFAVASENSFPHGCGIASSASGFAALTVAVAACLTSSESFAQLAQQGIERTDLAHLARLGSGSACRSLWGGFVQWERGQTPHGQKTAQVAESSHWPLTDTILLLDTAEKKVSSREAHRYVTNAPGFGTRVAGIAEKAHLVRNAIAKCDFDHFGMIVEQEALEMHAMSMTATPAVHYLSPETWQFLSWLREQRQAGAIRAYATMDAGANVHLLAEAQDQLAVLNTLKKYPYGELETFSDYVGSGPKLTTKEC